MLIEDAAEETLIHRGSVTVKKEESAHIRSSKSIMARPDTESREEKTSDKIERGTPIRVGSEKLFIRPLSGLPTGIDRAVDITAGPSGMININSAEVLDLDSGRVQLFNQLYKNGTIKDMPSEEKSKESRYSQDGMDLRA